ncbi:hypothetical protein LPJ56_003496 [Coemansia sp. RSA 2599]|nr:hypothetical protein LPJ56_003496 [Coemansia sp. RSA 2599]KAJ1822678.1 hypothetical protein LPJ75_000288 [Coemansia sp. RSA 2598]
MRFSSFPIKSMAAACALAHVASAGLHIPTTSIENTSEYFEGVSKNWENIEHVLESQMNEFKKDGNYGAYVIMTSIYNSDIPDKFDSKYLSSLLKKLDEVGTKSWDDKELSSIGAEHSEELASLDAENPDEHSSLDSEHSSDNGSAGLLSRATGAWSLAAAAAAALALSAF